MHCVLRLSPWHNSPEVMCVRWVSEARALPSSWPHVEDVQNPLRRASAGPFHRRAACSSPRGGRTRGEPRIATCHIWGRKLCCVFVRVRIINYNILLSNNCNHVLSHFETTRWVYAHADEGPPESRAVVWLAAACQAARVAKGRGSLRRYRSYVLMTCWLAHSLSLSLQNKVAGST